MGQIIGFYRPLLVESMISPAAGLKLLESSWAS